MEAAGIARIVGEKGNRNSASDAGVAALAARTAAEGAYLNVIINLAGIKDRDFAEAARGEAEKIRAEVAAHVAETMRLVEKSIAK